MPETTRREGWNQTSERLERHPSGCRITANRDWFDGQPGDTTIDLKGSFAVAGSRFDEFVERLDALVDEYRI